MEETWDEQTRRYTKYLKIKSQLNGLILMYGREFLQEFFFFVENPQECPKQYAQVAKDWKKITEPLHIGPDGIPAYME